MGNLQMELLHRPQNQWPSFGGKQWRHTRNGGADAEHTWEKKPATAPFLPIMSPNSSCELAREATPH